MVQPATWDFGRAIAHTPQSVRSNAGRGDKILRHPRRHDSHGYQARRVGVEVVNVTTLIVRPAEEIGERVPATKTGGNEWDMPSREAKIVAAGIRHVNS